MFDNPREELARLQEELLAAEAPEEEEFPEEPDFSDFPDWDDTDREPLSRSYTDADPALWQEEEPEPEEDVPAPKHYTGLKFAIALELLALAALFWWWYLWIK